MTYTTKQDVLDQIGVERVGQIRGDKMIEFSSLLDEIDPAVAKEIITQIPEFTRSALDVFAGLVRTQNESNDAAVAACHDAYRTIIDTLSRQVEDQEIPFEQKRFYLEKMMVAADKMSRKDSENKEYFWKVVGACAAGVAVVVTGVLAVMGIRQAEVNS